jgi:TldD protein
MYTEDDQVRTRFVVNCVASGDEGMQTAFGSVGHTMGFELFARHDVESIARDTANTAMVKLRAQPAPSGPMPVVLKHGAGGVLFHEACGHGLEADHIAKGASVFAGKKGEQIASPLVTLVDDGTVGGEWGASGVDDEGHLSRRNTLIENGVLTDYMWDYLRAQKAQHDYSGNGRRQSYQHLPMVRMTNTFLTNGETDPDEIIRQTERGIYVSQLGGGNVNTATGDFTFSITEAYLIERGEITKPVRQANLMGNGPEVLRRIDVVGNDFAFGWPGTCGKNGQSVPVGQGQPTLRVASGLTIGGTA